MPESMFELYISVVIVMLTHFICLQRGGTEGSNSVPFNVNGGSSSIEEADLSLVGRSLIVNACPPIELADPGSTLTVVTPPEILSL